MLRARPPGTSRVNPPDAPLTQERMLRTLALLGRDEIKSIEDEGRVEMRD